jgi:hypothetical protein
MARSGLLKLVQRSTLWSVLFSSIGSAFVTCQSAYFRIENFPHNITFLLTYLAPQTDKARADLAKAEGKFDQYRKDASNKTLEKIDAADRKIEEGAAKAKSGISSWFGGK